MRANTAEWKASDCLPVVSGHLTFFCTTGAPVQSSSVSVIAVRTVSDTLRAVILAFSLSC